jgi:hypothetical protein
VRGLGLQIEVVDAVMVPVLGVAGVRPGAADDLNGLGEGTDLLGRRERRSADGGDLVVGVAATESENEPAAREQVE